MTGNRRLESGKPAGSSQPTAASLTAAVSSETLGGATAGAADVAERPGCDG